MIRNVTNVRGSYKATILLSALLVLNVVVWAIAFILFNKSAGLIATCLLAWTFGLRHAVDADHIAAIDNVTRKMMQQGKRPFSIGAFFSFGHSTIVILATLAIALTAAAFKGKMDWFHNIGGVIGTTISACFLLLMALVNLVILRNTWKSFEEIKQGKTHVVMDVETIPKGGLMSWLFSYVFRLVNHSWHMYFVGFLFGLGFDTATEVGLLSISAAGATHGMPIWSIMIFPILFASGMAFIDSVDNIVMVGAYGWAFNKPQRKIYYNITVTGASVIVAFLIGGIEALGLLGEKFDLQGLFWQLIYNVNDNFGDVGFIVIGLFVIFWAISVINYRMKGYDKLDLVSK